MGGSRSYHVGLAAEETVVRNYKARGYKLLDQRWRGKAGEIDLIFEIADLLVMVEVKAAPNLDRALNALSFAQLDRIAKAAEEYVGDLNKSIRIDLAAVDKLGRVEIVTNITA